MRYWILGSFYDGIPWEDFFTDGDGPHVTISAEPKLFENEDVATPIVSESDDGWIDLDVPRLTRDVAVAVLASVNGLDFKEIEIVEVGELISI